MIRITSLKVRCAAFAMALVLALLALTDGEAWAAGPLKLGDRGTNVKKVQSQLESLGYYQGKVDGKFGSALVTAVKTFQSANRLKVTGAVGSDTRKALDSGKAVSREEYEGLRPLKAGMKNGAVKEMQQQLKSLGYFSDKADGVYDTNTGKAVALLQKANSLRSTGVADTTTRKLLKSGKAVDRETYEKTVALKYGHKGYAVTLMQQRLKQLGYSIKSVSGIFDKPTVYAVKSFQDVNGLKVTGNADVNTRKLMNSTKAVSAKPTTPVTAPPTPPPTPEPTATAKPTQKPTEKPAATPKPGSSSSSEKIETVIATAKKHLGKPYILGMTGTSAFDCSGLTLYCFKQVGVSLPRTAYLQGYQDLKRLSRSELKRGDLLVFDTISSDGDKADHVGIYLGDGEFIHASSSQHKVVISKLSSYSSFSWGLRIL